MPTFLWEGMQPCNNTCRNVYSSAAQYHNIIQIYSNDAEAIT